MGDVTEDYLKAIYKLQTMTGKVSTSALAERMGVTPPSATSMVTRLAELGLLRHDRYKGVELTEAGARTALEVIRHHRLWELFLAEALRVPLDRVHQEAERLEHSLSDDLEERMDRVLGHPTVDPHGDPIPTKDGHLSGDASLPLSDLVVGAEATVTRVPDSDAALLRYLSDLGLIPGRQVRVTRRAPFGGTLFVETGGEPIALGEELAHRVFVSQTG
ncbi:MAG: metal-dependent transcriptional regulator [Chloroflexota bacterium]